MSLTKKVYLTISGYDIKLSDNLTFYQKDQLKLIFYINEYGIDYENNATARALMPVNPLNAILFIENPDGVDSVSSAKIEDNAVTFYLDSTHTQYVGISRMQLRLFDQDGCAITLPHFTFEIRENIYGSGDVRFQNVVMVDQTGTVILTEDNDMLDVGDVLTIGTEVAYPQVTKTIKELPIKHGLDGTEKLIVEDNEATKQAPLGTIVDEIKQNSQEKIREIESELNQTNAQLSQTNKNILDMSVLKRDKDVLISMNDLSDDVKQAMTGGSVAVVGEASVTTNSIVDNAIIYEKIKQSNRKGLSVMNVDNLLNNPLLDVELGGYYLDNCRLTSDYKIDGFNTLEIGDRTNTANICYQRNFNIQVTDAFNWLFTVECENEVHIKPAIIGYKNNTYVAHLISHQYVVKKSRELKIEFTTDRTLYDEYRFVLEITTDGSISPDKICWVGKQRVVNTSSDNFYSLYDEIYSLYDDLKTIEGGVIINNLKGKTVSFNGDSICYGDGYAGGYGKIIAERNNMIYENVAANGSSITKGLTDGSGNPRNALCESVTRMRSDADYVILEGGINDAFDWKSGKFTNIGSITQDYSTPLDTTTFCGALETYLKTAKERFSGKKVGYIIIHRMPGQSYPWGTQSQNSFTQIRELIIQACNKYSIPYCDLFNQGLNTNLDYMRTAYTKNGDGVHPNKEGYERFYCDVIEAFMMSL